VPHLSPDSGTESAEQRALSDRARRKTHKTKPSMKTNNDSQSEPAIADSVQRMVRRRQKRNVPRDDNWIITMNRAIAGIQHAQSELVKISRSTTPTFYKLTNCRETLEKLKAHAESNLAKSSNDGTQRSGSPDGPLATETRKPGSLK